MNVTPITLVRPAEPVRSRAARKGAANPFFGHRHTAATKAKQSKATRAFNLTRRKYELKVRSVPELSERAALYLAGLLDGKGTLGKCGRRWCVSIYATDPQWLNALKDMYGGTCCKAGTTPRRALFVWQATSSRDVFYILSRVLPYLKRYNAKAQAILADLQQEYGAASLLRDGGGIDG
jgi:hypothetical protein